MQRGLVDARSGGLSRRRFLQTAGGGVGALALGPILAPILAACGSESPNDPFAGEAEGIVDFANWPLYLDKAKDENGATTRPSLLAFTEETGIEVNYREVIPDAEAFYDEIEPLLVAGRPTGWDIMVITNGLTLTKLIALDQLVEIPSDRRPQFDTNADPTVKDPAYDPGNRYTMAWQSGITGIAYNPLLTGRPISSLRDLFDPAFAGKVGMFGDIVDLPNLTIMATGTDPETSTPTDWRNAADLLRRQRDEGILAGYYQQSYVKALQNGDIALSMAWSGDIFQANAEGANLRFVVPEEGAILWTDTMCIPRGAQHPVDAVALMDFVYRPDIAALIAAWVNYVTPVPAARDQILALSQQANSPAEQARLRNVADSDLVFLPERERSLLRTYRPLASDDEITQWESTFGEFQV
jgi:spermidine/putrescine transport system substrate-binding protein